MMKSLPRLLPFLLAGLAPISAQDQKKVLVRGPYLQNVTSTSIVVCFQTLNAVEGTVEYGADENYGQKAGDASGNRHVVELKGLKPATKYFYRTQGESGSFVTAPEGDAQFTFVVYGDCRTGHETHARVAAGIAKANPAFVVNTGDLVDRGDKTELWTKFFEIAGAYARNAPFFPVLGNHDQAPKSEYYDNFVLPGGGRDWYSFDYGAVHFTMLNMNPGPRTNQNQINWATADLANTKAPIKFVVYHQPAFSASTVPGRAEDCKDVYQTWGPIFENAKVTAAFQGHNHNYQRAIKNNITYITSGGGGAERYNLPEKLLPETKYARAGYHYIVVSVEPKSVNCKAIDVLGQKLDEFSFKP